MLDTFRNFFGFKTARQREESERKLTRQVTTDVKRGLRKTLRRQGLPYSSRSAPSYSSRSTPAYSARHALSFAPLSRHSRRRSTAFGEAGLDPTLRHVLSRLKTALVGQSSSDETEGLLQKVAQLVTAKYAQTIQNVTTPRDAQTLLTATAREAATQLQRVQPRDMDAQDKKAQLMELQRMITEAVTAAVAATVGPPHLHNEPEYEKYRTAVYDVIQRSPHLSYPKGAHIRACMNSQKLAKDCAESYKLKHVLDPAEERDRAWCTKYRPASMEECLRNKRLGTIAPGQ